MNLWVETVLVMEDVLVRTNLMRNTISSSLFFNPRNNSFLIILFYNCHESYTPWPCDLWHFSHHLMTTRRLLLLLYAPPHQGSGKPWGSYCCGYILLRRLHSIQQMQILECTLCTMLTAHVHILEYNDVNCVWKSQQGSVKLHKSHFFFNFSVWKITRNKVN